MATKNDINGKRSSSWPSLSLAKDKIPSHITNKSELLINIKSIISHAVELIRSNSKDVKYRAIIDLIMLRVKSVLSHISSNDILNADDLYSCLDSIIVELNTHISSNINTSYDYISNLIIKSIQNINVQQISNTQSTSNIGYDAKTDLSDINVVANTNTNTNDINTVINTDLDSNIFSSINTIRQNSIKSVETLFNLINERIVSHSDSQVSNDDTQKQIQIINKRQQQKSIAKTSSFNIKTLTKNTTINDNNINSKNDIKQNNNDNKQNDKQNNDEQVTDTKQQNTDNVIKYNKSVFKHMSSYNINVFFKTIELNSSIVKTLQNQLKILNTNINTHTDKIIQLISNIIKNNKKSIFQTFCEHIIKRLKKLRFDKALGKFFDKLMPKQLKSMLKAVKAVIRRLKQLYKFIKRRLKPITKRIRKILTSIITGPFRAVRAIVRQIKNVIVMTFKAIKFLLSVAWKALVWIAKGIKFLASAVGRFFKNSKLGRYLSTLVDKVKSKFKSLITDKIKALKQTIVNKIRNIKSVIQNKIRSVVKRIKNFVKNIVKKLKNSIRSAVQSVARAAKTLIKKMVSKIKDKLVKKARDKIKKKARKSLMKMGTKIVMKILKKIGGVLLKKLIGGIAKMAIAAIPILGQIIAAGMIIWDIYSFIKDFMEIKKFIDETPGAWDMMKEMAVAELEKALNWIAGLCEAAKKLFYWIFVEYPKMVLKGIGKALNFLRNPNAYRKKSARMHKYAREMNAIATAGIKKFKSMPLKDRLEYIDKNFDKHLKEINHGVYWANVLTKNIDEEEDSVWRNNDAIIAWMDDRHSNYRHALVNAVAIGLEDFTDFSIQTLKAILTDYREKKERAKILAEQMRKRLEELKLKYGNKRINIDELKIICKENKDKMDNFINQVNELDEFLDAKYDEHLNILEKHDPHHQAQKETNEEDLEDSDEIDSFEVA